MIHKGHLYEFTSGAGGIVATRDRPLASTHGQAISTDGGKTFQPHGSMPIPANEMPDVADAYKSTAGTLISSTSTTTNFTEKNPTGDIDKFMGANDPKKMN